jgi:hypothetical protein
MFVKYLTLLVRCGRNFINTLIVKSCRGNTVWNCEACLGLNAVAESTSSYYLQMTAGIDDMKGCFFKHIYIYIYIYIYTSGTRPRIAVALSGD